MHGDTGLLAQIEQLIERGIESHVLTADVADIAPAPGGCRSRQIEQFGVVRIDAGVIFEPAGKAERACLDVIGKELLHADDFGRRGDALVVFAHDCSAQISVAGIGRDIDRGRPCGILRCDFGKGTVAAAILANHDGGHALCQQRRHAPVGIASDIVVAVRIDEAWGEGEPARRDHRLALARL